MSALEPVLQRVYDCPRGLTCRPGRGVLYPSGARGGPGPDGRASLLLMGWNPRVQDYARDAAPDYETWKADLESHHVRAAAAGDAFARTVAPLLPPGRRLDEPGVMSTFLWKWPTRLHTAGESSQFYVQRCVASHLWEELRALRPRVLLTYDKDAADWWAREARERGLAVHPAPPAVRASEVAGLVLPSDAWGWRMGLVLVRSPKEGDDAHDRATLRWAHLALARVAED